MVARFETMPTPISGLNVIRRLPIGDERGYLERMYCRDDLGGLLGSRSIVQINHTLTEKVGTVRGLHFQRAPHGETKLVSCLRGSVYDVAVDLRPDSPTFLHWHAEMLSQDNHRTLVIPEGFAHGFQSLTSDCEMLYLHTAAFHAEAEFGIDATDPRLAIPWPLPIAVRSARDSNHPSIATTFGEQNL